MQRDEDRGEADARRQQQADQHRRDERDRRAAAVQIRRRRAIDLLPEVAAGRDERAAEPDLADARSNSGGSARTRMTKPISFVCRYSSLFPQKRFQPIDEQRGGKEQAGEAEKADEDPGDRRAVIADRVGDRRCSWRCRTRRSRRGGR